ncbi:MAG: metalloregulator ArsR/SmtB family transcription factor [Planctomycetota bacterium]
MSDAERELADTEEVFSALAHASRRHILLVLHYRGGEMSAGDIAKRFECTWPTVTRHLGVLCSAGLVEKRRDGRQSIYRLDYERLRSVVGSWVGNFEGEG